MTEALRGFGVPVPRGGDLGAGLAVAVEKELDGIAVAGLAILAALDGRQLLGGGVELALGELGLDPVGLDPVAGGDLVLAVASGPSSASSSPVAVPRLLFAGPVEILSEKGRSLRIGAPRWCACSPSRGKLLWIFGVPTLATCVFFVGDGSAFGIGGTILGLALCVLAASHRAPGRDPGIRLLLEHPEAIDRVLVYDAPGMTQIVFCRGEEGLAFLDIEDPGKFSDALDVVTAHLPDVPVDYEPPANARFVYANALRTFIARF